MCWQFDDVIKDDDKELARSWRPNIPSERLDSTSEANLLAFTEGEQQGEADNDEDNIMAQWYMIQAFSLSFTKYYCCDPKFDFSPLLAVPLDSFHFISSGRISLGALGLLYLYRHFCCFILDGKFADGLYTRKTPNVLLDVLIIDRYHYYQPRELQ